MGDRHRGVRRVTVIEDHTSEYSTRILLVEDHASFRQALAFMFEREREFVVTGQAGSLAEARAFMRKVPDVVEAVRRLKSGEALLSPAEVIEMLRMVSRKRQEEYEAQRAIEKLTPREKQVLQALGEGLDSKDIAEKLHITIETERPHMDNIHKTLGPPPSLEPLVFAARHGLVEIG